MKNKILVLNICKEKLHYFEFVKPIEDILKNKNIDFYTKHYTKFEDKDLKADKIIICGTSLKDNYYLSNLKFFKWIDFYNKPLLGICGGMQILSNHFKVSVFENQEIGLNEINFKKDFLGFKGKLKVYQLHNFAIQENERYFESYAFPEKSNVVQAIKHKDKQIYGVLFHPEVRNKELVEKFCELS